MAYIGIGYSGTNPLFLHDLVEKNGMWLKGDRQPRFFGDRFLLMYDSNTAREFARRCKEEAERNTVVVYPVGRPYEISQ
jgi:hypothetical protein